MKTLMTILAAAAMATVGCAGPQNDGGYGGGPRPGPGCGGAALAGPVNTGGYGDRGPVNTGGYGDRGPQNTGGYDRA